MSYTPPSSGGYKTAKVTLTSATPVGPAILGPFTVGVGIAYVLTTDANLDTGENTFINFQQQFSDGSWQHTSNGPTSSGPNSYDNRSAMPFFVLATGSGPPFPQLPAIIQVVLTNPILAGTATLVVTYM